MASERASARARPLAWFSIEAPAGAAGGTAITTITLTALFQSALDLFDLAKINGPPMQAGLPGPRSKSGAPAAADIC